MAEKILVAVDGSPSSEAALRAGVTGTTEKTVLQVLPGAPPQVDPSHVWDEAAGRQAEEEARLRAWAAGILPVPEEVVFLVTWGETTEQILATAAARGVERILIGARGMTRSAGQGLGAVATDLLRRSPLPVWVIHEGGTPTEIPPAPSAGDTVQVLLQRTPVTISQDDSLATALARMETEKVHQLPVLQEGRLIGILTRRDLLAHLGYLEQTHIDAVMTRSPVTIRSGTTIVEAGRILIERGFNALPVLDGEQLVGVVTRTDLLRRLVEQSAD